MGLLIVELKKEHIALLKAVNWNIKNISIGANIDEEEYNGDSPFGGDNLYDDMDVIINGIPVNEFDPFNGDEKEYTTEQKAVFDKLLEELPLALDIILKTQSFELGTYVCRYHDRDWKKKKDAV
jgi:hypothetical protein